jgi:hypothetical protein
MLLHDFSPDRRARGPETHAKPNPNSDQLIPMTVVAASNAAASPTQKHVHASQHASRAPII